MAARHRDPNAGTIADGNIGAGDRLDLTAIGRDVNGLARVEAPCKVYGQSLATGAFAESPSPMLTPIDTVRLRGFTERQTYFGLREGII